MAASPQLALFTPAAAPEPTLDSLAGIDRDRQLVARLAPEIHLGTSAWTFTGWRGIVYPGHPSERALIDKGLATYARHPLFRTVGVERAYYAPLRDEDWRTYAEQLPDGFRCVMKAWSGITTRVDHRTLEPNPNFLDAGLFEDRVLAPIARSFFDHIGPIVLEFPPIPPAALPSPARFIDELDRFLTQLPREFSYAVELRNRELLTPTYLSVLRHHRVGHVLNLWERMPTIGEQMALPGVLTASFVVCRLMIRPGARYAQKKAEYAPFDRIVERDDATRGDVAALANLCVRDARSLFVIVNNKVEGSSPLTVRGIVERIVGA